MKKMTFSELEVQIIAIAIFESYRIIQKECTEMPTALIDALHILHLKANKTQKKRKKVKKVQRKGAS